MSTIALLVSKWGNSLAVRLPADFARRAGIRDGDTLTLDEAPDGALSLRTAKAFDRKAYAKRLQKLTADLPMGTSVIDELRRDAFECRAT